MTRFPKNLLLLALSFIIASCAPDLYEAENLSAEPFNQLELAGNACGPAALLNSWRFGKPRWRKLSETPAGLSDRERIRAIARGPAMRESSSLPGRARWSRNGINLIDLRDVANEMSQPHQLPPISHQTLFLKHGDSQRAHLSNIRSLLARSLADGFPPMLSIRRFVKRGGEWVVVQGHFVTITSVPGGLASDQSSFEISYIDPLGGDFQTGTIAVSPTPFLGEDSARNPNLEAVFPESKAGMRFIRPGETSYLAVSAALGRF